MAQNEYRGVGAMYVCAPTNHFADVQSLLSIVGNYKRLGGKMPAQIEAALELAKTGENAERALNVACDGLFKFYVEENFRCAREAGFSGLEQYENARRSDPDGDSVFKHEDCVLRVERRWQWNNIDYAINPLNPESALRQFLGKTADQVMAIVSKYVKKSALKEIQNGSKSTGLP